MNSLKSIAWSEGRLRLLDQRLLPHEVVFIDYVDHNDVAVGIREMVVRGAPAIGAAGAYGLVLAAAASTAGTAHDLQADLDHAAAVLRAARPTAVNLTWAIERVITRAAQAAASGHQAMRAAVLAEAQAIQDEDVRVNRQIGLNAMPLVPDSARILHHCNTGSLATCDYGTALGIIRTAHEQGKRVQVYVDETRPRLQGARLTTWELQQLQIPHTLIVDGAAAHIMRTQGVELCVVGCDRVAANGDTANKIGTYHLALAAAAHGVPFYVAAPTSTIDLSLSTGDNIEIEERPAEEVTHIDGRPIPPEGIMAANPAFDVTPASYITAIITEAGIAYPPYIDSLAKLVGLARTPAASKAR
jgi:methylthioribose-1-phosphate isomerase